MTEQTNPKDRSEDEEQNRRAESVQAEHSETGSNDDDAGDPVDVPRTGNEPSTTTNSSSWNAFLSRVVGVFRAGFAWFYRRGYLLYLYWRLHRRKKKRDRLLEQIGQRIIDLDLAFDEPEIEEELQRLEREEEEINQKINELEDEIQATEEEKEEVRQRYEKDVESIEKKKEPLREKKKLNEVSLERARKQLEKLNEKKTRIEQRKKNRNSSRGEPDLAPAGAGSGTGSEAEEDRSDPEKEEEDREQISDDIDRVEEELEELREKREKLDERMDRVERQKRSHRKKMKRDLRNLDAKIKNRENRIRQLERDLDSIAEHKRNYARDLGRAIVENGPAHAQIEKYTRRLSRTESQIERVNRRLDELQVQIEEMDGFRLLFFFLFWVFLVTGFVAGYIYLSG